MLTHRSTLAAGLLNAFSLRFSGHTVHALTGSMSFVSVVPAHILSVLRMGGTVIMMGKWDVEELVSVIERERATFTYAPSPTLSDFAAAASRRPEALVSLNAIVHSASRGDLDAIRAVRQAIGVSKFIEAWGMTEHSGAAVTATVPGRGSRSRTRDHLGRPAYRARGGAPARRHIIRRPGPAGPYSAATCTSTSPPKTRPCGGQPAPGWPATRTARPC